MSNSPFAIVLPLFDATSPTSAALSDQGIVGYGGVVSRSGDTYWLHITDDLIALGRTGDPTTLLFKNAQGLKLEALTAQAAAIAGLDFVDPQPESITNLCAQLGSEIVIGQVVRSTSGRPMVMAYISPNASMRLSRQRYICSKGQESHDEQTYRAHSGKCPLHAGGILR